MKDRSVRSEQPRTNDRLLMRQAAMLLAADLSLGELFDRLTRMLAEHVDSSVVFIALARPDGHHSIEYFYDHGEIRRYPHIELEPKSRARVVISTGEIVWGNTVEEWAPEGRLAINHDRPWTNDSVSAIFVPMRAGGAAVGALSVQSPRENAYDANDVDVIAAIGHYLAIAVQNQRMYQELQRSAEYDALTSLVNHSKLSRELDTALLEATPVHPCVAVMFDVVNFGRFNEIYGYAEGDEVLRRIARALVEFENADCGVSVGRFGGDVFLVLLRDATREQAAGLIARLCRKCDELAYVTPDVTLPISLACGYVIAPFDPGTRAELMALCLQRTRLSRKLGCVPVGADDVVTYTPHGTFTGIETIVDGVLERDPYTRRHAIQVNSLAKAWAEHNLELDCSGVALLLQSGLLHDAGKLLISDRILMKPAKLTTGELAALRQHALFGAHILAGQPGYEEVAQIVGAHHERWDGSGYPNGLAGEEIHPLARSIAIMDAYAAMVADQPYRRGVSEDAALAELQRRAGTQFDPALVERFVAWRLEVSPPRLA